MNEDKWFDVEEVRVWGGQGSVAANTQDLERAAQLQAVAQEQLAQVRPHLFGALQAMEREWHNTFYSFLTSVSFSSAPPALPSFEQERLRTGISDLTSEIGFAITRLHSECEDLGLRVFQSAQIYSRAEDHATTLGHRLVTAPEDLPLHGFAGNPFFALTYKLRAGMKSPGARSLNERLVSGLAAVVNPTGFAQGGTNLEVLARKAGPVFGQGFNFGLYLFGITPTQWDLEPGKLVEHTVTAQPASTIHDVVNTVVDNRDEHDGQIMVQQQTALDGTQSWVVYVPGTQEWDLNAQSHPIDASGNLDLMSKNSSALPLEYLQAALEQAGIGPDDPVTLIGHSQGGIAVQQAQMDPWFSEHINLQSVVTVCSPVSLHASKPEVKTLHIENNRDFVPTLDGRSNPDSLNRVTVHATVSGDGSQHSVEQNMAILNSPLARQDPSVNKILGDINANVGVAAGGSVVTTFYEAKKTA